MAPLYSYAHARYTTPVPSPLSLSTHTLVPLCTLAAALANQKVLKYATESCAAWLAPVTVGSKVIVF